MADGAAPAASVRLLGIRHHGPGSARAVRASCTASPPDIVLIEAPADADGIAALAGHPEMQPPVAMLAYVTDHPERAVFHPFASFSPEWVALTWAIDAGVPVRFIDVAAKHALAEDATAGQLAIVGRDTHPRPLDPLGELADAAGYDDAERWWEDVVEHRLHGPAAADGPFVAIGEAMGALRSMYEPTGEPVDPVEARREAHMRAGIRTAVRDGYRDVVVVCGAWHVPALGSALQPQQARHDAALLRGMPKVKAAVTWVPWTHRRLATATGYGAGVIAPGWYHHLYAHAGRDVIARWFAEAAQVLRAADLPASAADVVEATRLADALAALRGRPLAGLAEVDDAARAVLGHGTDLPMRIISSALVVGDQIGAVPTSTPMVPLARSLAAEQKRCRLKPEGSARTLELDLRKELHLQRSELLHRLTVLGVAWGAEVEGRRSAGTFRETWQLRWEPEHEVRLIEASGLGTTVESACTAALLHRARQAPTLGDLTVLLERCLLARLDAAMPELLALVADRSAVSLDVARLMEALPPLARTVRYGDVRRGDAGGPDALAAGSVEDALDGAVRGIVSRIAAGLAPACVGLDDEGSAAMAVLVRETQSALSLLGDDGLLGAVRNALAELSERDRVHGLLQGLATRLLTDGGVLDADATERRVARSLSAGTAPLDAAAFVEGFLGSSGAVLVHDPLLLGVFDRWLASLAGDSFTDVLPLLRRTFGAFEPAARRSIGERVRTGEGPGTHRGEIELDPERVAAGLHTVAELLGVTS